MILTADKVRELTGRTQHAAQQRVLDHMGIRYTVAPDGSLRVHEDEVRRVMVGGKQATRTEPDAAALLAWQGKG